MRSFMKAAVLSLAVLGFAAFGSTQAQMMGGYGYPGFGGVPAYGYYGNGGHDLMPHWHQTTTPFGTFGWYGNGAHDLMPHQHIQTPYSYQGFSVSPFGYTRSFYPSTPYGFRGW